MTKRPFICKTRELTHMAKEAGIDSRIDCWTSFETQEEMELFIAEEEERNKVNSIPEGEREF